MYGLGFENNPLGAENCMSSKSENLKLLDSLHVLANVGNLRQQFATLIRTFAEKNNLKLFVLLNYSSSFWY